MKSFRPTRHRPKGFTLVELLVVILIIGVVSAVTLPTVLPALAHRQVSESARTLQAAIEGARDAAIRANAPRGIRLLPDPAFPNSTAVPMLASNRIVPIEPAGRVQRRAGRDLTDAAPRRPRISADKTPSGSSRSAGGRRRATPNPTDLVVLERPDRRPHQDRRDGADLHDRRADGRLTANPERFVNVGPRGRP